VPPEPVLPMEPVLPEPVLPIGPVLPGVAGPLLEVEHVSAGYGQYRALFDVSLSVDSGAIVAVLGPNGAGKSTLARTVSGLVRPSAGHVRFGGVEVGGLPAHRLARRGLVHVPEGRGVFASLTVEENLLLSFGGRLRGAQVAEALTRAYEAFPILAERRRQWAGTLSGGQQRLLSMAKVLAAPARLLVVDELSLGLAPSVVDAVYDGLLAIRASGTALLVVEQQVDRALAIADMAVVLAHGQLQWRGPASQAARVIAGLLTRSADGMASCADDRPVGTGHHTNGWAAGAAPGPAGSALEPTGPVLGVGAPIPGSAGSIPGPPRTSSATASAPLGAAG
jgi:branched-chain amino acid transport system ATP-binding protein